MSNNISRRSFLKGAAAVGVSLAATGMINPKFAAAEAAVAKTAEAAKAKPEGKVDGKYVTKAVGHESFIYVATTIFGGKITACQVLAHEETMGIGNYACARIPAAIVANQSIEVPNVRGCSITSMAIKRAVKEAIELSGYDVADFSTPVVKEVVEREETAEADVVIIGAGTVGLVVGARLLDKGKKVILVEKRDIPGGSGPMAYGGVAIAGCELYDNYDVTGALKNSYYGSVENMMGFWRAHPFLNPEYDRFDKAMPYMTKQYENIGHLVDWFTKIGLGFNPIGTYEGGLQTGYTPYLAPGCYEGGAGYAMMFLEQRIKGQGGTILYDTEATELIQAEDGRVTGVKAKSGDGASWTLNGKAVILASGGFMRNAEMIKQYYPEYEGQFFNCASASTGDGIKMGLAVGGYMECTGRALPAYLSTYASKFEIALIHHSTPGIMVNAKGDNIGNIVSDNHYKMAAAKLALDTEHGGALYYVFDDAASITNNDFEGYGMNTYKAIMEKGEAVRYDSVAAAAEALNLPNLAASIEANNKASLAGEADAWGRKNCPYIETRDGVWVLRVDPTFYLTTGGLAIDVDGRMLKEDGSVIPGLYAGGDVVGSIEEKDGKKYGMGFDAALAYGYILGETVDAEL
ncbi:MAG: FAD-dependent oxidoreductase [Clostridia bacterium]|nr:FAD-dependent oxidoreductase [Clostridia bacterium]